uniref:1-deoxy-D-xylulose 5-phosphate reductoisomerase n=1 Tax=Lygus hesperus TaxID=30085 RepID=A0A0A9W2E3_LYGHE
MPTRRLPRNSQKKSPSPPIVVDSAGATTTDTEESDPSQITVESTTNTPSSSNGSLPITQMPSVIDLTANSQKQAEIVQAAEKLDAQHRNEGLARSCSLPRKRIRRAHCKLTFPHKNHLNHEGQKIFKTPSSLKLSPPQRADSKGGTRLMFFAGYVTKSGQAIYSSLPATAKGLYLSSTNTAWNGG